MNYITSMVTWFDSTLKLEEIRGWRFLAKLWVGRGKGWNFRRLSFPHSRHPQITHHKFTEISLGVHQVAWKNVICDLMNLSLDQKYHHEFINSEKIVICKEIIYISLFYSILEIMFHIRWNFQRLLFSWQTWQK